MRQTTINKGAGVRLILPDGSQIAVSYLARKGREVRLGLSAPAEVVIMRSELIDPQARDRAPAEPGSDHGQDRR